MIGDYITPAQVEAAAMRLWELEGDEEQRLSIDNCRCLMVEALLAAGLRPVGAVCGCESAQDHLQGEPWPSPAGPASEIINESESLQAECEALRRQVVVLSHLDEVTRRFSRARKRASALGQQLSPEGQASAEIKVTPEMAAAGGDEIWGNPSMIDGDQCNELAAKVYRRMERIRLTEAGASAEKEEPRDARTSPGSRSGQKVKDRG